MKVFIEVSLDNSAFADEAVGGMDGNGELQRILTDVVSRLPQPYCPCQPLQLYDVNGNRVGYAEISE